MDSMSWQNSFFKDDGSVVQQTYYDVLQVSPTASRQEIRASYVRLKQTYNQSNQALYSLFSPEESAHQLKQIEQAFNVLCDDHSRQKYDLSMGKQHEQFNTEVIKFASGAKEKSDEITHTSNSQTSSAPGVRASGTGASLTTEELISKQPVRTNHLPSPEVLAQMQEIMASSDLGDGETLAKLRELTGVSEQELQDRTKICIGHIKAIESNNFDRLPRVIFVKGFLRSYCKYLGIPESESIVLAFTERLDRWQNK